MRGHSFSPPVRLSDRKEFLMKGIRFVIAGLLLLLVVWVKLEDMRKAE
ncbi:MAG: hypothetical protein LBO70_06515 [Clostridiales Family XIII bacterium]|jgi:hypothetical protein|nr:hypothetical protein [Clostridiales Family XIII bacterium]